MTIQEIKNQIEQLALKHHSEQDDELAYLFEMKADELILQYLVSNNITAGNYDLLGLLNNNEEYEDNRTEIIADLQLEVLMDPAPFNVHPDLKELYTFYQATFWPDN
jgi:hypothetical protein